MPSESPFDIQVHRGNGTFAGFIGDPISCNFTPRLNGLGSGALYLKTTDPKAELLLLEDARVTIDFRGHRPFTAKVRNPQQDIKRDGQLVFQLQDDWRRLKNTRALIAPGENLTRATSDDPAQTGRGGYYDWGSPASREEAILTIVAANFARIEATRPWLPTLDVAPNLGRGGIPQPAELINVRSISLDEAIAPLLAASGLRARLWQPEGSQRLRFELFEPRTWPIPLELATGSIREGTAEQHYPELTTMFHAGPGESTERLWYPGPADTDLEQRFGDVIEGSKESTQDAPEWPEAVPENERDWSRFLIDPRVPQDAKNKLLATFTTAATAALAEGAPSSSVSADLQETPALRYLLAEGSQAGYDLGDVLTVELRSFPVVQPVTEVTVSHNASNGLSVTPTLGEIKNDPRRRTWDLLRNLYIQRRREALDR